MARRPSLSPADSAGEPIFDPADGPSLPDFDIDVDLDGDVQGPLDVEGASLMETSDGGIVIDFDPAAYGLDPAEAPHDANLAEYMEESERDAIAVRLDELVEKDKTSRKDWEDTLAEGIALLGLNIEKRTAPFDKACGVYDTVMAEAVLRFQAESSGEMLPPRGPAKAEIFGVETEEARDRAFRKIEWMNFYLTQGAPEYYEEMDQMLFWNPLVGSTFKKIYQCPVEGRPVAPFILPEDFIVPFNAVHLSTAPRATQVISMTFAEVKRFQLVGEYLDVDLPPPDSVTVDTGDNPIKQQVNASMGLTDPGNSGMPDEDATYKIHEAHCTLDLKAFPHRDADGSPTGLPVPYRVTYEAGTKKTLAIYRNWREADPLLARRQYFVHYKFVPGLGFYGLGYAHLLGSTAKTGTTLRRQMIDAETLAMFPGGLRTKGFKLESNNLGIGPTEFREIDTGGLPIQQAVMALPYKGANEVSLALLKENKDSGKSLGGTSEIAVGDGRQDAPVGTTVALMEAAMKPQTAIMKRQYRTQSTELKMIADLFGEYLPEGQPYPFPVRGQTLFIVKDDFINNIDVVPVANPNVTSSTQRMVRAEGLVRSAMQAPDIHDMRAAYANMYREMNVPDEEIARLLPAPQEAKPLDPLSENMNALMQKPIRAAIYQDHDAHIEAHSPLAQGPAMQAHIAEHMALKMRVQVEQFLQIQLPPPGTQLPPEIENKIAVLVASAMKAIRQEEAGSEPTQGQLVLEQLRIEAQKVSQRAQEAMAKDATDRYKAEMKYREKMVDVKGRERVARIQAAVDVADNQMPIPPYMRRIIQPGSLR